MAAPSRAEGDRHQASGSQQQQAAAASGSSEQQRAAAASWQQQQGAAGNSSSMAAAAGGSRQPEQGASGLISKHSQQPRRGHRAQRNLSTREPKRTTCSEHFKEWERNFKTLMGRPVWREK